MLEIQKCQSKNNDNNSRAFMLIREASYCYIYIHTHSPQHPEEVGFSN